MTQHPPKTFAMIVWDDAHGTSSDQFTEEEIQKKHKGARYQSYGWLIRSDEIGVTLVCEWEPAEKSYRAQMFIPRGMVVEEKTYRLTPPRKPRAKKPVEPVVQVAP